MGGIPSCPRLPPPLKGPRPRRGVARRLCVGVSLIDFKVCLVGMGKTVRNRQCLQPSMTTTNPARPPAKGSPLCKGPGWMPPLLPIKKLRAPWPTGPRRQARGGRPWPFGAGHQSGASGAGLRVRVALAQRDDCQDALRGGYSGAYRGDTPAGAGRLQLPRLVAYVRRQQSLCSDHVNLLLGPHHPQEQKQSFFFVWLPSDTARPTAPAKFC